MPGDLVVPVLPVDEVDEVELLVAVDVDSTTRVGVDEETLVALGIVDEEETKSLDETVGEVETVALVCWWVSLLLDGEVKVGSKLFDLLEPAPLPLDD